jgi:MoaA/NifB/PqqE/SkfB family radical SAM enzyme
MWIPYHILRKQFTRPILNYLELHLTDHCNLNCKGCGHFCPIAGEWFANIEQHAKDMEQLSKLFSKITKIRLMGGEPLLHPDVTSFLSVTRHWFPASDIRLVTNGILLPQMPDSFWAVCQSTRIAIDMTVYPPLRQRATEWIELVQKKEIPVYPAFAEEFSAHMNLRGDSDPQEAFRICRKLRRCIFLQQGKLYICAIPAMVHYFNKKYGTHIKESGFVDIHQPGLTGWKTLEVLSLPAEVCCYCSYDFPTYPWAVSERTMKEWDVADYASHKNAETK